MIPQKFNRNSIEMVPQKIKRNSNEMVPQNINMNLMEMVPHKFTRNPIVRLINKCDLTKLFIAIYSLGFPVPEQLEISI
jgi:hypothetical protein